MKVSFSPEMSARTLHRKNKERPFSPDVISARQLPTKPTDFNTTASLPSRNVPTQLVRKNKTNLYTASSSRSLNDPQLVHKKKTTDLYVSSLNDPHPPPPILQADDHVHRRLISQVLLARPWRERYDSVSQFPFYWNFISGITQWERPSDFWKTGVGHRCRWVIVDGTPSYYENRITGQVSLKRPHTKQYFDGDYSRAASWIFSETKGLWRNFETNEILISTPRPVKEMEIKQFPFRAPPSPPSQRDAFLESELELYAHYVPYSPPDRRRDSSSNIFGGSESMLDNAGSFLTFHTLRGIIGKRGGGTSFFWGSSEFKPRYLVCEGGTLQYWKTKADYFLNKPPLKNVSLDLRHYGVYSNTLDSLDFSLIPRPEALLASLSNRIFHFRTNNFDEKSMWINTLKGQRADFHAIPDAPSPFDNDAPWVNQDDEEIFEEEPIPIQKPTSLPRLFLEEAAAAAAFVAPVEKKNSVTEIDFDMLPLAPPQSTRSSPSRFELF